MNPYNLLGIDEEVSYDDLKKRYKTVCKMFHPDKHGGDKSAVFIFQMITKAYNQIKESKKRTNIPKIPKIKQSDVDGKKQSEQINNHQSIVPGTNITENDIRILGQQLKDPWFNPDFNLTDFFGDVAVPEKNENNNTMRPVSTRR